MKEFINLKSRLKKNILASTSIIALMIGGGNAFAGIAKTSQNAPSSDSDNPAHWAPVGAVADGDWYMLGGNHTIFGSTLNQLKILGIDVNGKAPLPGGFQVKNNTTMGSIGDSTGGNNKINIVFTSAAPSVLTLDPSNSFGLIESNVFTHLGDIDFTGASIGAPGSAGRLVVKNSPRIVLDSNFLNANGSTLDLSTDLEVNSATIGSLGTINFNNSWLVINEIAGPVNINSKMNFNGGNSQLVFRGDDNHTINGDITSEDTRGIIIYNGTSGYTLNVFGKAGSLASKFGSIQATKGGNIFFLQDTYIDDINITGGNGEVRLGGFFKNYYFKINNDDFEGKLIFDAPVTLLDGTMAGSAAKMLEIIEFSGAHSITIDGSVELHADEIKVPAPNQGGFYFTKGSSIINAEIGSKDVPFGSIFLQNPDTTVELKEEVWVGTNIILADNPTLKIADYVTSPAIYGVSPLDALNKLRNGTINFVNTFPIKITSDISFINSLVVENENVEITGTSDVLEIRFTNPDKPSTLQLDTGLLINFDNQGINVSTAGNAIHTIAVMQSQDITGNIGGPEHRLKSIKILNDGDIDIDTSVFYSGVTTAKDFKGTVYFSKEGAFAYGFGEPERALKEVLFPVSAEVRGSVYAQRIDVHWGKTAYFNGNDFGTLGDFLSKNGLVNFSLTENDRDTIIKTVVKGSELNLYGEGSTAIFGDRTVLASSIIANEPNKGNVYFEGDVTLISSIGAPLNRVNEIEFLSEYKDRRVLLGADIFANHIRIRDNHILVMSNVVVGSDLTAEDIKIDFANQSLAYQGNADLSGDLIFYTTFDGQNGGQLVLEKNSTFDFSNAKSLTVILDSNIPEEQANKYYWYYLLEDNDKKGVRSLENVSFVSREKNPYVQWKYDVNTYLLYTVNSPDQIIQTVFQPIIQDATIPVEVRNLLTLLANSGLGAQELINMFGQLNREQAVEAASRLVLDDQEVVQINSAEVSFNLYHRITELSTQNLVEQGLLGMAAGENIEDKYGVWFNPFYASADQGVRSLNPGFTSHTYGGSLGADTRLDDKHTLGIALSYVHSKVKNKNKITGDYGTSNAYIASIYGQKDLTAKWVLQAHLSLGVNSIERKDRRLAAPGVYETAVGKYGVLSQGLELNTEYNFIFPNNHVLTPSVGFVYTLLSHFSYKEEGTTNQNLSVRKKLSYEFNLLFGCRYAGVMHFSQLPLEYEIRGLIEYDPINRPLKLDVRLDGISTPLPIVAANPGSTWYNIGGGLTTRKGKVEYGINYDATFNNKYIGHQGMLTLRVNL